MLSVNQLVGKGSALICITASFLPITHSIRGSPIICAILSMDIMRQNLAKKSSQLNEMKRPKIS